MLKNLFTGCSKRLRGDAYRRDRVGENVIEKSERTRTRTTSTASSHSMYRECTRVLSSALLALTGCLQAEALAQSPIEGNRLLTLSNGKLPLVIVAPHGGREAIPGIGIRQGDGVAQFKTGRDHNTAELAGAIALKLGEIFGAKPFLVIARFDRKFIDANRPFTEAYEALEAQPYYAAFHGAVDEACKQIRKVWGRGLLLDIHGQGAEANVIFRGTRHGKSVAGLVQRFGAQALTGPRSILGQLALSGYKILPDPSMNDRESRYSGGHTVQTYGSHRATGIDAIQLEFGTRLRARDNVDRTAADVAAAIRVFAKEYLPTNLEGIEPSIGMVP
jgi:N-formylglutamate amidohydrolase